MDSIFDEVEVSIFDSLPHEVIVFLMKHFIFLPIPKEV